MPALTTIAIVAAGAAALGSQGYQAVQADRAQREQKRERRRALAAQEKVDRESTQKALKDRATTNAAIARDRQRLLARRAGSSNRGGTLATSSVGLLGSPNTGQKTLLGA